jgi:hypothetical protein
VAGQPRAIWWRLWFLAALIPIIAGLVYGIAQAQIRH